MHVCWLSINYMTTEQLDLLITKLTMISSLAEDTASYIDLMAIGYRNIDEETIKERIKSIQDLANSIKP